MVDLHTSSSAPPITKVSDIIATYRPTKHFKSSANTAYTSLDFDDSGEFLLLARTDDTLHLYNTKAGAAAKELKSQKYGCALARFTHHSMSILYASTKVDDGIRYLGMHDNNFIRYFRGHEGRVTSLCVSPSGDTFLSGSLDQTVKQWDLRSSNAQGEIRLNSAGPCLVAYDPSASVMAIASAAAQQILLYDTRQYDKPPFTSFDLLEPEKKFAQLFGQREGEGWTGIEFSNNGTYILVTTTGPGHYILDAFSGDLLHYLHRPGGGTNRLAPGDPLPSDDASSNTYTQADAAFTPDGRYVIGSAGSSSTTTGLLVWDLQGKPQSSMKKDYVLEPMTELPCAKSVAVVAHNPRFNMLASAEREVMMWLPDLDLA